MSKDDNAVKNDAVSENTAATDSAPVDDKSTQVDNKDVMEASLEDLDDDNELDETVGKDDSKAEEADEPDKPDETQTSTDGEKPLAPKSENRFQKLANDNRDLRDQITRLKTQETQVATEQELMGQVNPDTGDYYTPQEAERMARQQSNETLTQTLAEQRYNLEVQNNQETIRNEASQALQDFPMFDESNKSAYNADLAQRADDLLKQALIFDDNGTLVGSQISPYQLYKTIAESSQANAPQMQAAAQKANAKMLANADRLGGASQASKQKVDPMVAAFSEEAGL